MRTALVACAVVAGLAAGAPQASAATRSVAPGGADSGDCVGAPCGSLGYAYARSAAGDVVQVRAGLYGRQSVPSGSKAVTFRGGAGVRVRQLISDASNVTYDGIEVDAGGVKTTWAALELHGSGQTFKNAAVGNVVDEKGLLVSGANHTVANVLFHDAVYKTSGTHMECVYAIDVPGFTVRNSTFRDCAVMDLFFTHRNWSCPCDGVYGNVTIENNVFHHSEQENNGGWNYYSLYIAGIGPGGTGDAMNGWVVRNNTFEQTAFVEPGRGTGGTRWVGNLGNWDCKSGVRYSHNVGQKCSGTDKQVSPASSSQGSIAALGWANPAANDFRLRAGSPAIDAGDPNDHPVADRAGLLRNGPPDAGAHEYGGRLPSGAAPPPPPQGSPPARRRGLRVRRARLGRHVICKRSKARGRARGRRRCPGSTRLRLAVTQPSRVAVRLYRVRRGKKLKLVSSLKVRVRSSKTLRIRASKLRRGRYLIVVRASTKSGRKSAPQRLRLRVR